MAQRSAELPGARWTAVDRGAAARRRTLRPQRPLREAVRDAHARAAPEWRRAGFGARARAHGAAAARAGHASTTRVLRAMGTVPRHRFVDTALVNQAYEDTSLPIGLGQTISKPSVVARMIELLLAGSAARARNGAGHACSRSAPAAATRRAVLAQLGDTVVSVERLRALHDKAREHLAPLRLANVRLVLRRRHAWAMRRTRRTTASSRRPAATSRAGGLAGAAGRRRPAGRAGAQAARPAGAGRLSTGAVAGTNASISRRCTSSP